MKYLKNISIPVVFLAGCFLMGSVLLLFFENAVLSTLFADMIVSIVCLFYYKRYLSQNFTGPILKRSTVIPVLAVLFVLVFFACQITATWYYALFGDPMLDARNDSIGSDTGLYFVLAAFIAPICEEILMRGIMFRHFCNIMPVWAAGLISAFIFGFVHGTAIHVFSGTLFGLYAVLVYYMTKKLKASIAVHSLYNICTFFSGYISVPDFCFTNGFVLVLNGVVISFMVLVYTELILKSEKR